MPRSNKPKFEIVEVTPQLAREWLDMPSPRHQNRRPSEQFIDDYAQAMLDGEWSATASILHFSPGWHDDYLEDGTHRLNAVIRAWEILGEPDDFSVRMGVLRGGDPDDFRKIDQGRARATHQFTSGPYAIERATAARIIAMAQQGKFIARRMPMTLNAALVDEWDADMIPIAQRAKQAAKVVDIPASIILAVMAQARRTSHGPMVDGFLEGIVTETGLIRNDPRIALIKRGRSGRIKAESTGGGGERQRIPYSYIVKAWNAYATGKTLQSFVFAKDYKGRIITPELAP